ncbi:MAG: type II secretion system minor pseudopilin GspJ [Thiobacillaceae bacterium]
MMNARGFTLMEVLVAMVLLSLFAVVAYRALDAVLSAQRHATAQMDHLNTLATAFTLMDSDLANATAGYDPQNSSSSRFYTWIEHDGSEQFDLVRQLPEDADQALQQVGYRCSGPSLSRLVWPDINNPTLAPNEFRLLSGLRACSFQYLNAAGQWLTVWQPQPEEVLPRAAELDIVEADGTPIRRVIGVQ